MKIGAGSTAWLGEGGAGPDRGILYWGGEHRVTGAVLWRARKNIEVNFCLTCWGNPATGYVGLSAEWG